MAVKECKQCGQKMYSLSKYEHCYICRKKGLGKALHPKRRTKIVKKCRLCGRRFRITSDRDPRWTLFCPRCRNTRVKEYADIDYTLRVGR